MDSLDLLNQIEQLERCAIPPAGIVRIIKNLALNDLDAMADYYDRQRQAELLAANGLDRPPF